MIVTEAEVKEQIKQQQRKQYWILVKACFWMCWMWLMSDILLGLGRTHIIDPHIMTRVLRTGIHFLCVGGNIIGGYNLLNQFRVESPIDKE